MASPVRCFSRKHQTGEALGCACSGGVKSDLPSSPVQRIAISKGRDRLADGSTRSALTSTGDDLVGPPLGCLDCQAHPIPGEWRLVTGLRPPYNLLAFG
jgi:hypothetical protein